MIEKERTHESENKQTNNKSTYLGNWHLDKFSYHKDKGIDNRQWGHTSKGLEMQAEPRSWRDLHDMHNGLKFILL